MIWPDPHGWGHAGGTKGQGGPAPAWFAQPDRAATPLPVRLVLVWTAVHGRRCDMGLGGLSLVSVAEAREKALAYRKLAREGGAPLAERRKARAVVPTFS